MSWHALYYPLKPGSEKEVGELFKASGRPQFDVRDDSGRTVGRLLGTMAFVGAGKAIRVIEIGGALPQVAGHMSRQPEVREFERRLEEHLSVPRDMRSPDGARAFFRQAALDSVQVVLGEQGKASDWMGVFYPVKAGHEQAVRGAALHNRPPNLAVKDDSGARVGQVRGMMFFVGAEKALRLVKVEGDRSGFGMHMARQPAAREFQQRLDEHLAVDRGIDSADSARHFFAIAWLECVLSRRHDQEIAA
jgi:SchA/CurD like domain